MNLDLESILLVSNGFRSQNFEAYDTSEVYFCAVTVIEKLGHQKFFQII